MGTYIEDIYFPLGDDEARKRIDVWREDKGKKFKLKKKGSNFIEISYETIHFVITLIPDYVRIEAWVGGFKKYEISPTAIYGLIGRRQGWKVYSELREIISEGIEPGVL